MKQKVKREFEFHRAYEGYPYPDGSRRWYTLERAGRGLFAVAAWRHENGLFERGPQDYYQTVQKLDYAESIMRGRGCKGDG